MTLTSMLATTGERWHAYLILALFIAAMVAVSVLTARKARTLDDFLLGSRGIGGWMSAFGYGTTYFSAVVFIGYAGTFGMSLGLGAVWIGIANAVIGSLLAWIVLAKRTRNMTQELNASTMPEFFAKRYDSKYLKLYPYPVFHFRLSGNRVYLGSRFRTALRVVRRDHGGSCGRIPFCGRLFCERGEQFHPGHNNAHRRNSDDSAHAQSPRSQRYRRT